MSNPLPPQYVDRLFRRFAAFYGSQKVGAMWADMSAEEIAEAKAVWGQALGRFTPASIASALQRLVDSGNGWPPTLPEFVELCRQAAIGRTAAMLYAELPAPGECRTDVETAKRKVAELLAGLAKSRRMPAE